MSRINFLRSNTQSRKSWLIPYLFIFPALFFYILFLIIPLLGLVGLSFTNWDGYSFANIDFNGIANYINLFKDEIFLRALRNNLLFLICSVAFQVTLALLIALILDRNPPFAKFIRGLYFMPSVMSMVVLGLVFTLLLSPAFGVVNPALKWLGLGNLTHDWLGSSSTALFTLIMIQIWYGFGFSMFIFIAGIQSIPPSLYDAAKVDGANDLQEVLYITIPSLRETIAVVIMLAMISSLKIFTLPFVMTHGGPNHATEVLSTWSYFKAFTLNETGYGATVATTMLLITLLLTYLQFRFSSMGDEI